jgi:hypothetical protein
VKRDTFILDELILERNSDNFCHTFLGKIKKRAIFEKNFKNNSKKYLKVTEIVTDSFYDRCVSRAEMAWRRKNIMNNKTKRRLKND